eukprot:611967-Prymnesium_polylepis.1
MDRSVATQFDLLQDGQAYGQRKCEGVHGLTSLKAHTNTFLVVRAPADIDGGGEILDEDVKNSDVAVTLLSWFGAEHADLQGKPRGIGLGKDFCFDLCSGTWNDQRCCAEGYDAPNLRKRKRLVSRNPFQARS